ncbi:autotransporter outer membrane beta-barrel domain-containing protein, partial [Campylobacter jejuni]|nr:autotransporter outer membrane beta-barrel domain-containing protein [Campylobacter jejuni]
NSGSIVGGTNNRNHISGVKLTAGSSIQNFTNSGFVYGSRGVLLPSGSSITNFNNSGTLKGSTAGLETSGTISTFTNNGLINSPGGSRWNNGIWMGSTKIQTFTNNGTIKGDSGIVLEALATIDNFTNKGTIEAIGAHGIAGSISFLTIYGSSSYIKTFTNEGVLKSNSQGIVAETGNKIDTLINKGTIEASSNGLTFFDEGSSSGSKVDIGSIILEEGSSIKAGNNGINLNGTSNKPITVSGSIEVKEDASVSGSNAGIVIGSGKKVNAQIKISGSVTGG